MRRTLSIHGRLFAGFAVTLVACCALMVAVIYLGIRYLPTYELGGSTSSVAPATSFATSPTTAPTSGPTFGPAPAGRDHTIAVRTKQDVWHTVLITSVSGLLLVTVLGLAAGRIVSRRLLRPLHRINRAAARAGAGDLSYRINADGPADEITQLADTFDAMLARLQESFTAHQRFAANASHELLTPLATNRAILQVAAADPTGAELVELVPMLAANNERNITIVTALLQLAGAEHAQPDADPVDLTALTARAVADCTPRAEAQQITLVTELDPDCAVVGNAALLRQLLVNLLDNALGHNHPGGSVHLALQRDHAVTLEVDNTGPPVDPDTTERLFEPFYRSQARIHSKRSGHGLGLAIVHAIVQAHHGSITATANPHGGLTVSIELPVRAF
ncbi:sensor histidine kinase [Streptacidiphilus sp. N1-12]|uniref:histidine kinase n=2 Tax=Streptacidiphilus alkalitolerans TaxID=3342712 RepID=A0ABV6WMC5_9ACTN